MTVELHLPSDESALGDMGKVPGRPDRTKAGLDCTLEGPAKWRASDCLRGGPIAPREEPTK